MRELAEAEPLGTEHPVGKEEAAGGGKEEAVGGLSLDPPNNYP